MHDFARSASWMGLALCLFAGSAQAQWKWRDDQGRIQFSDRAPPANVPERDILQRPGQARNLQPNGAATAPAASAAVGATAPNPAATGTPSGASATANGATAPSTAASGPAQPAVDSELERRRKAVERDKAAQAKAEDDKRKAQQADNCQRARQAATTFDSGQRIARVNEKGEREFLDERQRAEELRRAREVMASDCR